MKTNIKIEKESITYITFGITVGLVLGAFFGPAGAVVGVPIGAGLGFWFDKKYPETNRHAGPSSHKNTAKNSQVQ